MTYRELCAALRAGGIDAPEWEAQCLLEDICHADALALAAEPERDYPDGLLQPVLARRLGHEPLQYILGEWAFWRQTYRVSPDCLIPRADTEILVEEAVRRLPQGAYFADFCTGSGCIAISTLAERRDTRALAVDLSAGALRIAEENAARNGVADRVTFRCADLLAADSAALGQFDAILSNPPYICSDVIDTLSEEVRQEPRMALDGGADGLAFYRALLRLAGACLAPGGFCLFEIGYDQGSAIRALAAAASFSCTVRRDFGGQDRVAILTRGA